MRLFGEPQWDSDSVRLSEREHIRYCIEHTKPLDPRRVYGQLRKVKLPFPNEDLGRRNKNEMQIFDAFFKVSWPKLSTHALENRV